MKISKQILSRVLYSILSFVVSGIFAKLTQLLVFFLYNLLVIDLSIFYTRDMEQINLAAKVGFYAIGILFLILTYKLISYVGSKMFPLVNNRVGFFLPLIIPILIYTYLLISFIFTIPDLYTSSWSCTTENCFIPDSFPSPRTTIQTTIIKYLPPLFVFISYACGGLARIRKESILKGKEAKGEPLLV